MISSGSTGKRPRAKGRYGYYFILPYFVVFTIFGLYPIIGTIELSLERWNGLRPASFVGLGNYVRLVTDLVFYKTLWNTFRMWLFNYIPQILTALVLSGIFTFNKIRGMKFFRAAYYLPNLITAASVGLLFNLLFNGDKSMMNQALLSMGAIHAPVEFFMSGAFTSGVVSYIQWWMWFGYTTIIVIAGMTTVDPSIYEAAMIDGASKFATYRFITLPLIRPTILYLTVTSIIGGMQLFDVPAVLTDGAGSPQKSILTTAMYVYNQGFKSHNYGYACAISMGLFILILLLSCIAFRAMRGTGSRHE
jgi:multiple sugar transport system permease protein